MALYLSGLPLWISGLLIVGLSTVLAIGILLLVRRIITLERLEFNNEVAGFKYAVVGVLYAVLLAFAVIVVWEKFVEAERATVNEAGSIATMFRLSYALNDADEKGLDAKLANYLHVSIKQDWPAMSHSGISNAATGALDGIYYEVIRLTPGYPALGPVLLEMYRQLDDVTHSRRLRLQLSHGIVPNMLWFALVCGAALTIGFTFFFGSRNLLAQVLMTGMITMVTSIGLFVIVTIEYPFTGPVRIGPGAFVYVLEEFAPVDLIASDEHPVDP